VPKNKSLGSLLATLSENIAAQSNRTYQHISIMKTGSSRHDKQGGGFDILSPL
jgi:hypothetical protein